MFSAQLRQVLGLGNVEINFVPTMMVIGKFNDFSVNLIPIGSATSLDAGLFYEKFGPTPTALVGGLLFFFGYFMMFLSMLQLFVIPGWVVAIFGFFVGHGGSWAYTVALGTNLRNFSPGDRGKIVGIMTGNVALSGAIFTQFYKGNNFINLFQFFSRIFLRKNNNFCAFSGGCSCGDFYDFLDFVHFISANSDGQKQNFIFFFCEFCSGDRIGNL